MKGEAMQEQQREQTPSSSCRRRRRSQFYFPEELVAHILRRSSLWTSTRLQLVSQAWEAASREAKAWHQTPWIFLHESIDPRRLPTTGYLVSICGDGGSFKRGPLLPGSLAGSCDGWMAFIDAFFDRHRAYLLNPFTMSRVDLPPLPRMLGNRSSRKALFLFPSLDAALGCRMMASFEEGVAMWEPGYKAWDERRINGWGDKCIVSAAVLNEEVYVLDQTEGSVHVIDFASSTLVPLGAPGRPPASGRGLRQLAMSQGELLLVHYNHAELKGVHRLDLQRKEWVEVTSLGRDRALFVDTYRSALSVSVERAAGCRGDCVYLLGGGAGATWTVFDMATGAGKTLESSPASAPNERLWRGVWVSPNLG